MEKLPASLRRIRHNLHLVRGCENKAIYAQFDDNTQVGYEVIKICIRPSRFNKFLNKHEEEKQIYPSTEQWGIMGWTYKSYKSALKKYHSIKC